MVLYDKDFINWVFELYCNSTSVEDILTLIKEEKNFTHLSINKINKILDEYIISYT